MTGTEMEGETGFMCFLVRGDGGGMLAVRQRRAQGCAEPGFLGPVCAIAAAFTGGF